MNLDEAAQAEKGATLLVKASRLKSSDEAFVYSTTKDILSLQEVIAEITTGPLPFEYHLPKALSEVHLSRDVRDRLNQGGRLYLLLANPKDSKKPEKQLADSATNILSEANTTSEANASSEGNNLRQKIQNFFNGTVQGIHQGEGEILGKKVSQNIQEEPLDRREEALAVAEFPFTTEEARETVLDGPLEISHNLKMETSSHPVVTNRSSRSRTVEEENEKIDFLDQTLMMNKTQSSVGLSVPAAQSEELFEIPVAMRWVEAERDERLEFLHLTREDQCRADQEREERREAQRRADHEREERREAQRRADEAQRRADEAQRRADEVQRTGKGGTRE